MRKATVNSLKLSTKAKLRILRDLYSCQPNGIHGYQNPVKPLEHHGEYCLQKFAYLRSFTVPDLDVQ